MPLWTRLLGRTPHPPGRRVGYVARRPPAANGPGDSRAEQPSGVGAIGDEAAAPRSTGAARAGEGEFYAAYAWCLNPLMTVRELLAGLQAELARVSVACEAWQRDERQVNIYLLACAVECTVGDYLARRGWNATPLAKRIPRLRTAIRVGQGLLDAVQGTWMLLANRRAAHWSAQWRTVVDQACGILAGLVEPTPARWESLRATVRDLSTIRLPPRLLSRRMRLPCPFRSQDLAHPDVLALCDRLAQRYPAGDRPTVVIGARTTGPYFAPLAAARLAALGWSAVSWVAARPKDGLTRDERQRLLRALRRDAQVVLIDDHPNTGHTFRLLLQMLDRLGVRGERVAVLAPRHPMQPVWQLDADTPGGKRVRVITLEPHEWFKTRWLASDEVVTLLREHYQRQGWVDVQVQPDAVGSAINAELARHFADGWHVHLKHVLTVQLSREGAAPVVRRVLAKSVGWGWMGYHAYLAGVRLAGFVPKVVALRNGMLFVEWVGNAASASSAELETELPRRLAEYVAARVRELRLVEDPCFDDLNQDRTGWSVLVDVLREAYGTWSGRLKVSVLHRALSACRCPMPALIDGHMGPADWLYAIDGVYKADFEHHNFGRTEMNIVDPAYDLTSAVFEFQLSEEAERELLSHYARASGDHAVAERILIYKLICGIQAIKGALATVGVAVDRQRQDGAHRRYLAARDFLTFQFNRFCARRVGFAAPAVWTERLFFLDLDGVFDREALGFAHTTPSGLAALRHLQARGFSVVLNSGRSVAHVRHYCTAYGLPGGVAEYGSVFVDAVAGRETPLVDDAAAEALARCCTALRATPGVFVDPAYGHAVRAFRYRGTETVGLDPEWVAALLQSYDGLRFITRSTDTYIVARGASKGSGLRAVKELLGLRNQPVVAMGDCEQDLPMFEAAQRSFAPANCAAEVRARAEKLGIRVMREKFQRGFFAAVRELLPDIAGAEPRSRANRTGLGTADELIWCLLGVAERTPAEQALAALFWRRL